MSDISNHRAYMLCKNPYQGERKKALFICSGGILRSPTAAHYAASDLGWNTRSAGILPEAVPQVNHTLITWADQIFCMEEEHEQYIRLSGLRLYCEVSKKIVVLDIPDDFAYRDPELVKLISAAISLAIAKGL